MSGLPNNGLQLTRSARCAPRATNLGQSLRAALAAEPGCSADLLLPEQGRLQGISYRSL